MSDLAIRPAEGGDAPAITEIYGHHALNGFGTFDTEVPPLSRYADLIKTLRGAGFPFLVATEGPQVVGFAYAAPFRPRHGWRFSFEDSIYLAPGRLRQGIGTRLLTELKAAARKAGARQMIAVIGDSENLPSVRVHKRCGFAQIGTFRDVGFKNGRWLDVVLMQAELGE